MAEAIKVKAEMEANFRCTECKQFHCIVVDLADYANIGFGVCLEETCSSCGVELLVEVV